MAKSLQDQLKVAGLIDEKKAKQLNRSKRKEQKNARKANKTQVDQHLLDLAKAKADAAEKDRQLNLEKNRKAETKALAAQIKQLIQSNAIPEDGDQRFNFADADKVKQIWVNLKHIEQLSRGAIAIAKHENSYVLVPAGVAEKIAQRDESVIVFKADQKAVSEEDDFYADFQIPDDITW